MEGYLTRYRRIVDEMPVTADVVRNLYRFYIVILKFSDKTAQS